MQHAAEQEQDRTDFLKLKQQLEMEFNQKRAKFKELYLSKEEELKRQAAILDKAQAELSSVQTQLTEAKTEMETIKAVATISESTKQEAIDQVKQQWQEEVASLQAIMKDADREVKLQFQQKLEQERAQWAQYRDGVEREIAELRRRLSEGQEEENLENEMKKAQEDAEKLRSVVMPMESEIAALKAKLSSSEDRVKELEAAKVKELNHVLEAEKSCRTDLEMYVAVLNTQKSVLQEDAEKLRKELHEVVHLLELERQQHNQLKHTWQRANDQFLESQRLLMRDMQRIESVLSSEQLRQVEEMKKRDQEEDEMERLSQAKESHLSQSIHSSLHSLDADTPSRPDSSDPYKDGLRRVQSTDSLGSSGGALQPHGLGGQNNKAKSASQLDESDFGPLVGADCGGFDSRDTSSMSSLQPGHFLLTKDQEKAIKAMTPEQEETASLLSSISHTADTAYLPPSGYRLVSESEWNLLQQELKNAGRKLGRRCDMCSNYEKQLQVIQGQEAETRDQVKKLQAMLRQANDQLERTMNERQELEDSVKQANEETTAKISELKQKVQESESLVSTLQQAFSQAKRNTQEQMAVLLQSREQVTEELNRLQRDNESLQGKHRLHMTLQQQEDFHMPATVQVLQHICEMHLLFDSTAFHLAVLTLERTLFDWSPFFSSIVRKYAKNNLKPLFTKEKKMCKDKAQRLQTELDVSEQVQRDFVKLSQTLQVQLERIRQADSLERIRAILNGTNLTDISQLPET
uniref:Rab GTPase-binding effector protein 1 n=1 Tax=Sinocyclocheilus grahami TaxID=75366 RepID=A0A672P943_SINGR